MFNIDRVRISRFEKPKIIAEIGINHAGKLADAMKMAEMAVLHGADVVKHQTHIPNHEMSIEAEGVSPGNDSRSIFDVISENSLPLRDEIKLAAHVRDLGVPYMSTPFSREAADFLEEEIGISVFKIGSGECNNYPFVEYVASKGRPVILSTGMNSIGDVQKSTGILSGNEIDFCLMHTTNLYPTPSKLLRLGGLAELAENFAGREIGLSDHSTSNSACLAAVALGATFVERHFTDTKERIGPDISCSMDPFELGELRKNMDEIHDALGGTKYLSREEEVTSRFAFASISSTRAIEKGEKLSRDNIWPMRPSGGDFGPGDYQSLLGQKVMVRISERTQIARNMLEDPTP